MALTPPPEGLVCYGIGACLQVVVETITTLAASVIFSNSCRIDFKINLSSPPSAHFTVDKNAPKAFHSPNRVKSRLRTHTHTQERNEKKQVCE